MGHPIVITYRLRTVYKIRRGRQCGPPFWVVQRGTTNAAGKYSWRTISGRYATRAAAQTELDVLEAPQADHR